MVKCNALTGSAAKRLISMSQNVVLAVSFCKASDYIRRVRRLDHYQP